MATPLLIRLKGKNLRDQYIQIRATQHDIKITYWTPDSLKRSRTLSDHGIRTEGEVADKQMQMRREGHS